MTVADIVNPPPAVELLNYPSMIAVVAGVLSTAFMLFVSGKFDPTGGILTISILIVLGTLGAVAYCLIFTIPNDDITPGIVGALSTGFGAVVAYWLGHRADRANGAVRPPETPKEGPPGG